ncbi:DUF4386 domain-containing protein [Rheinheimera sp. 4Y26]|uniref:DUF4386 domain-containing protein n=1 Tax=Rheinheimera sp. 4Y26 TaxID=2977811 RepID=UPI0021B0DC32|nr:DUF4386 domain-containing protein [Rheinheimera sp. 4Y26]MCT6699290.1 DUF4386 domain-containing protein [Rheinheimera sp. 4Y26]
MNFAQNPNFYLRLAGVAYLANIALGLFGETVVRGTLVVAGDAAATAANIANSPGLWRAGIGGDLLMQLLDIPLIVLFYLLLKPVHHGLAITATLFNIVQTSVLAVNKLALVAPLLLLAPAAQAAMPAELLAQLTAFWVKMHSHGFGIGLIFFGVTCIIRGYLIVKSEFLPAFLGYLLIAAGGSYVLNSAAQLLAPDLATLLFPWVLAPSLLGELAITLWFLCCGLKTAAWQAKLNSPAAVLAK